MKLKDIVIVKMNEKDFAILEVMEGKEFELFVLGFKGNEEYIRLTKGNHHSCSIKYKDGHTFTWEWGIKGSTLVSSSVDDMRRKIVECFADFGVNLN